jgi:hypothetical protein
MMRLVAIALLAAILAGCDTIPHEVKVPVPVPCKVERPQAPVWATTGLAPGADIFDQVKALLVERRQRAAYEAQLEAAIEGCQP